ncbi:unnamed protein product [Symbiodinium pilosum]|uniref:Uncharacterized protein n=1 Tax=Symbiodinium pilosum TaxID=2952 RepID=A0A812LI98_SYMPI|nr:unnamed protein product [Symbiodinium pilosum]
MAFTVYTVFMAVLGVLLAQKCDQCSDAGDQASLLQSSFSQPHKVLKHLLKRRRGYGMTFDLPTLSQADIDTITQNCKAGVDQVMSGLRTVDGQPVKVVMQIVIMPRATPNKFVALWDVGAREHDSAFLGSRDIARAKAYTALAFSSNENSLSSGSIGFLANDGGVLPGIESTNRQTGAGVATFGGGFPLYNQEGKLIGAVGVSGDGVGQDEQVALACSMGYETPLTPGPNYTQPGVMNPLAAMYSPSASSN